MPKLEEKRIKDNNFQQYEKCITCGSGFWAISEYELGNWQKECDFCRRKRDEEEEKAEKKLLEEVELHGEKVFSGGKLVGRMYKSSFYFDETYELGNSNSNIDEIIRKLKRRGEKVMYWSVDDYFSIDYWAKVNGFQVEHKDGGFIFMGAKHFIKS